MEILQMPPTPRQPSDGDALGPAIREIRKNQGLSLKKIGMRLLELEGSDLKVGSPEYNNKVKLWINELSRLERGERRGRLTREKWPDLVKACGIDKNVLASMMNQPKHGPALPDTDFVILKHGLVQEVVKKMKSELMLSSLDQNAAIERLCRQYVEESNDLPN